MEDYRRNVTVGIFMAFGLASLGVLVILYGQLPEFFGANTYSIKTIEPKSPTAKPVGLFLPCFTNDLPVTR